MEADQPIQTSNQDRFGRKQFAQRIAHVVASREDKSGIVVGIYARWGEAKTSVLNMIKEELSSAEYSFRDSERMNNKRERQGGSSVFMNKKEALSSSRSHLVLLVNNSQSAEHLPQPLLNSFTFPRNLIRLLLSQAGKLKSPCQHLSKMFRTLISSAG
jgi:hypothetical protein